MIIKVLTVLFKLNEIVLRFPETILEAVMVFQPAGRFNDMGKKAEIIPQGKQGILMHLVSSFMIKVGKDTSVLSQ